MSNWVEELEGGGSRMKESHTIATVVWMPDPEEVVLVVVGCGNWEVHLDRAVEEFPFHLDKKFGKGIEVPELASLGEVGEACCRCDTPANKCIVPDRLRYDAHSIGDN